MRPAVLPWEARSAFTPTRTLVWSLVGGSAAALVGRVERSAEVFGAPDRSLAFALGVLLPLFAVGALAHLAGGTNLRELGAPAARYGLDRRAALVRGWSAVTLGLVLYGCLLALVALLASRGLSDAKLGADLLATLPVAGAAAVAYGAWLAAGACFGLRGAGVLVALLVDWLAGATALPIALATPRGHVRYLLGLEGAFTHPAWVSFAALLGLSAVALGVVLGRTPR
jgi:hypothetical protein